MVNVKDDLIIIVNIYIFNVLDPLHIDSRDAEIQLAIVLLLYNFVENLEETRWETIFLKH